MVGGGGIPIIGLPVTLWSYYPLIPYYSSLGTPTWLAHRAGQWCTAVWREERRPWAQKRRILWVRASLPAQSSKGVMVGVHSSRRSFRLNGENRWMIG